MPRNTENIEYITVAIRRDSNLMRQLEIDSKEKSQPKSHLLVSYAADYVRLFLKGEMWQSAPVIPIGTVTQAPQPVIDKPVTIKPDLITSDLTDDDLDAYGD